MLAGGYSQLLVEPPLCPYPTHPNLQAKGVPGPQPLSWIGLVKPKLPTHKKRNTSQHQILCSYCCALQEEEPAPRAI